MDTISTNITTLTTTNIQTRNGVINGLLYVPDIPQSNPCHEQQYEFIPRNVTTQAQLPPTTYNLIALAPWFNTSCTQAYLASARLDPIRGFIFYRPNNSTREPQGVNTPVWNLGDDNVWQTENHFPVFAVPGSEGLKMMEQLSFYSGGPTEIPNAEAMAIAHDPVDEAFIRVFTELTIRDPQNLPAMWTWILIVIGALLFIITCVSITMHLIQRQRRATLRRRVISGEVDLEAMGIKRMTVPVAHIKSFPLFTYSYQPDSVSVSTTPVARPLRSPRSLRTEHRTMSDVISSSRTRRSSITSTSNTVATNNQPQCHICLEHYEDRVTIIRELPCGHIFHPSCIDEFLGHNSSLCPICKKNMLPEGFCPKITSAMVRRERAVRRLRERVILDDSDVEDDEDKRTKWTGWFRRRRTRPLSPASDVPLTPVTPIKESHQEVTSEHSQPQRTLDPHQEEPQEDGQETQQRPPPPPASATNQSRRQKRRRKPRNLHLQTPISGDAPLEGQGRMSPSALARQRMRTLAGSPVDDPDGRRPVCKWCYPLSFQASN